MKRLSLIFLLIINSSFLYSQGLNELITSAVTTNSKIKPFEYEKLAVITKIDQNNKQPAPMIEIMQDKIPFNFMTAGVFSAAYSQPLKLFGKTTASEEYYSYLALKPDIAKEEIRKDIIKDVKENYFMLFQNERMLSTNLLEQEIIKSITSSIEIKYSTGKGSQNDILKSNSELQKLLYEEIQLKTEKKIILNNLRTLTAINLPENYRTKDVELLLSARTIYKDTLQLQKQLVENNPEFKYLEYEKKVISLEKNIAVLERKPDITLRTGYMYMSDVNEHAFQLGVGIELPFMPWNSRRIDAMIEEARYKEMQIESQYNSSIVYAMSELRNKISLADTQIEKIKFIREITIPQLEQTLKAGLISYQSNESEYMNVIDSYRMLRENDFTLIEEETKYLIYMNEIERLVSIEILKIN